MTKQTGPIPGRRFDTSGKDREAVEFHFKILGNRVFVFIGGARLNKHYTIALGDWQEAMAKLAGEASDSGTIQRR